MSGGVGAAEQESLGVIAAERADEGELVLGLDSFGDGLDVERVAHRDDAAHECCGAQVGSEGAGEAPVDLDDADREIVQERQRRVAGAEVVERDADAEFGDLAYFADGRGRGLDERGLGDLQTQPFGR